MDQFKTKINEVKIEEIVEEVSKKDLKSKKYKRLNIFGFGIFVLISGFLGLITSYLIFNLLPESFKNQSPIQELIKKN